jgi:hypothetical protein
VFERVVEACIAAGLVGGEGFAVDASLIVADAEREAELLPVPYFHLVFSLPAQIADIAYQNKAAIYGLLFKASAETLITIAADPKHLGAHIGVLSVLHTWGSALKSSREKVPSSRYKPGRNPAAQQPPADLMANASCCARCGLWRAREPTAATSIQDNSGLPQGPAGLPLAGSTCGKPAAHRGPLAGMIDGGTAREILCLA